MKPMRWPCTGRGAEISTVFDLRDVAKHDDEKPFIWTMKRMFRDID
jgi:hypothetical protein